MQCRVAAAPEVFFTLTFLALGFGTEYDLTSNLGFEGELSHLFDVAGADANVDWSVTDVSANAISHFDVRHWRLYAGLMFSLKR